MSNESDQEFAPRICQRGVDGSPGCGHPSSEFNAFFSMCEYFGEKGMCRHKCDFSPSPLQPAAAPVHKVSKPGADSEIELSSCCKASVRLYTADLSPYYVCGKCGHFQRFPQPAPPEPVEPPPARVWITWDDCYAWNTPETGGDEYVRVIPENSVPSDKTVAAQFHKIWTSQVGTEGYDKDQWQKLRTLLDQRGVRV